MPSSSSHLPSFEAIARRNAELELCAAAEAGDVAAVALRCRPAAGAGAGAGSSALAKDGLPYASTECVNERRLTPLMLASGNVNAYQVTLLLLARGALCNATHAECVLSSFPPRDGPPRPARSLARPPAFLRASSLVR